MGREHDCTATMNGKKSSGRALLETEELIFRGESFRLRVPFKSIKKLEAKGDDLRLEYGDDRVVLALGAAEAAKWANAIKNPKSRVDKLGIKPGQSVSLLNIDDEALEGELVAKGAKVTSLKKGTDAVFFGASKTKDLAKLVTLREKIAQNGAIWVVRPKGVATITERDVLAAAKEAGLVDVKVVKLSETHTAEKLVIPVHNRER
jgi:hypothetical protein